MHVPQSLQGLDSSRGTAIVRDFGIGEALVYISEHGVLCKAVSISYCWPVRHFNPSTLSFFHSFTPPRERKVRGGGKKEGLLSALTEINVTRGENQVRQVPNEGGGGGRGLIGGTRQR